jgi:hypothetical protein
MADNYFLLFDARQTGYASASKVAIAESFNIV